MNGGKRIRPLMMLASAKTLDINIDDVLPFATSIELLHSFSLIHDDLPCMDDDSLRRGLPTTHIKFGEATTTLAADALQSLAFQNMALAKFPESKISHLRLISMIAESIGSSGMAGGQSLDLDSENKKLNAKSVENIYMLKTGRLLRASILTPTYFKKLSEEKLKALNNFSEAIGIAFQIQDDLIEAEGDFETIGKSVESDKSKNKAAYPILFGINQSKKGWKNFIKKRLIRFQYLKVAQAHLRRWQKLSLIENYSYCLMPMPFFNKITADENKIIKKIIIIIKAL